MNPEEFGSPLVDYYRNITKKRKKASDGLESFEVSDSDEPAPLGVDERILYAESELRRIVEEHLGNSPELHELARKIVAEGKEAYLALDNNDEKYLREHSEVVSSLEVVVQADGSRPSFLVRNGLPDVTTSPVGDWEEVLAISRNEIREAIAAVGRINDVDSTVGFDGTGFRIGQNLIATNRHVLQEIASKDGQGEWTIKPGVGIDFGHEFRATASLRPRKMKRVAFATARDVDPAAIDHTVLDLVLIELMPEGGEDLTGVLPLDLNPDWATEGGTQVFAIGYPARPRLGVYTPTLLEQLFQVTFGFKRLAPGEVIFPGTGPAPWSLKHDTTTLGGNSGSVVVNGFRPQVGAAIHYGGTRKEPKANWAHILGRVLGETDARSGKTLEDVMSGFGVKMLRPI